MDELDDEPDNRVISWSLPRTISNVLTKNLHLEPYGYAHASGLGLRGEAQHKLAMAYDRDGALFMEAAQIMEAFTKSKVDPKQPPLTTVQSELETSTGKNALTKDQSHAMVLRFCGFLPELGFRHVFLIQEPSEIFAYYRKAMYKQVTGLKMLEKSEEEYDIVEDDVVGMQPLNLYKNHHDLWKYVQENFDPTPLVLDATTILSNPNLKSFLGDLGLVVPDCLLQWPSSADTPSITPGEGFLDSHIHFYGAAMQSTCSMPREQLTSDVIKCVDAAMPYYQEMYKVRWGH